MIPVDINSASFFRVPSEKKGNNTPEIVVEDETEEKATETKKLILCRQCLQVITSASERIEIQGSHKHTFANPHGIVYEIGCFRSVAGCGYAGPPTTDFSWFAGFSWRITVCSMCLTHLGWLFISPSIESFSGLILDRLIEPE